MSAQQKGKKPKERISVSEELRYKSTIDLSEYLNKLISGVKRGEVKYYTPYSLATAYGIKISDAKKILNEAVKLGVLRLYSGGRRVKIYVPA